MFYVFKKKYLINFYLLKILSIKRSIKLNIFKK